MSAMFDQITLTSDGNGSYTAIAKFTVTVSEWNLTGTHFQDLTIQDVLDILNKPTAAEAKLSSIVGKAITIPVVADQISADIIL